MKRAYVKRIEPSAGLVGFTEAGKVWGHAAVCQLWKAAAWSPTHSA
jgi:hypothetical protein